MDTSPEKTAVAVSTVTGAPGPRHQGNAAQAVMRCHHASLRGLKIEGPQHGLLERARPLGVCTKRN